MHPRIAPLLTALLLTVACDGGKTDAKADAKKTDAKAADAKADDAKADDAKVADAKADDTKAPDTKAADDAAKEAEERKARVAKGLAELEEWKTAEATRWTDEVEAEAKRLAESDWKDASEALTAVLASKHRHPTNVERDPYRHPAETLAFLGLRPDMTVVEVGPGWGWYTEILAPVLAKHGKLLVTDYDPAGPEDEGTTLYARRFQAFMARSPSAYGKIERIVQKDNKTLDLGPDGSADMVLVVRGLHGWVNRGVFDENVKKIHAALEPGGVAAIVQHRANDDAKPEESADKGYLPQPWVVERFTAAGFTLEEASEINANPKDTKDYAEGVWTLPPTLTLGETDKAKYVEIGESDRMTLRFRKP
ncbi:class I SAM-dependent methyltransferase [Paraliomyxa miuraensis]|uniref:class I SAM-dependent methyltransferase n=1 Tax=Paraliomyxa miuraensis TaxID=376150 RepID=UPI00225303BD|nr:methyltransferase [Paraliomyxa miuraensis]MCX4240764.1 methyltransferase [Paraliomyxa miuraensis]